ncbi:ATP-binding domain-containing protein [Alicyclobacillus cycloheptanicus]|uniref:DNA helicase-2/ATP-dependent DNA helicase PcrA n=1 Tax=Alicyclobacillus cycloheptanicus TaxID=1457 RepID=A0ABT9XJ32_9BACL|nr:ATP-binding domain-containing protein [Alicyclobacillus cycloheptanicus]MDQ0190315.1 DNA helicase-2/ATP-dependent DNA helicase PcrA [Alicyclobacillus cycloheptanicus]WDM00040.1 ATP-binding domain-containing protein [Alicyclobacillus cycloheptanicus]
MLNHEVETGTVPASVPDETRPDPVVEERDRLQQVLTSITRQLEKLQSISTQFDGDDDVEAQTADEVAAQAVERLRAEQVQMMTRARHEPYFGRLDFEAADENAPTPLYIGKFGLEDDATGDRLVIDWRAPVASMFYSFTGQGDTAAYESPDGTIEGRVYLKRNIAIRNSVLQRVVDSYVRGQANLPVTDEFLLYRLTEHKDNRLRDIVSTIQAEQDRIIRAERNLAIVIQGVAGSGKTTVALHRLAYLLYQYKEKLRAERMIIFAPNAMFLDYISEVLPELGVGGIRQTTFAAWAMEPLGDTVKLRNAKRRLERWFGIVEDEAVARERAIAQRKGSLAFAAVLDAHVRACEENLVPSQDFVPWEGAVLKETVIRSWYTAEYRHLPLAQRKARVLARVKRWYEMELKNQVSGQAASALRKTASQRYRSYAAKWGDPSALALYQAVLADEGMEMPTEDAAGHGGNRRKAAASRTGTRSRGHSRPLVETEDLAALLYLHVKLHGIDAENRFDHVVIDEAQDFSPLQIEVLKAHCPTGSFTILGDLAQSIHTYQGISSWDSFLELFPKDASRYFQLDVSYRSTTEIIEFANRIITRFPGFIPARPVFRSGDPVRVDEIAADDRFCAAAQAVAELQQQGANTVAVLCRTEADCEPYYRALADAGIDAQQIDASRQQYHGGVSVLPVYLAKGLEFDAVVIVDADALHYRETASDARLLYVGCTRALHHLWVQYSGKPSPLL